MSFSDTPQQRLFSRQAAEQEWPAWFRPSKHAPTQARNVARSMHPMGGQLGPEEATCGTCVSYRRFARNTKVYLKCARTTMSRCAASDIRAKWRGCAQWEQAE